MQVPVIYGAGHNVWETYVKNGWKEFILPVCSNPNAPRSPNSSLSSIGKVPSMKNSYGEVVGIRAWQNLVPTDVQLANWAKDDDLGICIRCENMIALDCDCESPDISSAIYRAVRSFFGSNLPPIRMRDDAPARWLMPVRVSEKLRKQRILFGPDNMLELLGDGNQFVAEGTHPKGRRYEWMDFPVYDDLPVISPDRVDELIRLVMEVVEKATGVKGELMANNRGERVVMSGENLDRDDPLAQWLCDNGYVISEGHGQLNLRCPWEHEHTGGAGGETSTSYFFAGANGRGQPGFSCLHAHCAHRTYADLLAFARENGFEADVRDVLPELPVPRERERPVSALAEPRYSIADKNRAKNVINNAKDVKTDEIKSTIATVCAGIVREEMSHVQISADTFSRRTVIRVVDDYDVPQTDWRPVTDSDVLTLWERFETEQHYRPIGKDLMRASIELVGSKYPIDTLKRYIDKEIPEWDGSPRVESFFSTYCGAEDCPFSRALGRYLFAALWGRASEVNGIKADIVPILVGKQGIKKSTLAETLALKPDWFTTISLDGKVDDSIRKITGRVVVELPELAGMTRKDVNDVKQFISASSDTMVDKWDKYASDFVRRCVFIMTTNEYDILNDPTGSRRFAPIEVTDIDIDAVERDLLQLWAEGRVIYEADGIEHKIVEQYSAERAADFSLADAWQDEIVSWLEDQSKLPESQKTPLTTANVLTYGVSCPTSHVSQRESRRISGIMRSLGYVIKSRRVGKSVKKVWFMPK